MKFSFVKKRKVDSREQYKLLYPGTVRKRPLIWSKSLNLCEMLRQKNTRWNIREQHNTEFTSLRSFTGKRRKKSIHDRAQYIAVSAGPKQTSHLLYKLAIAAKYAIAHKGILLEREKAHLEALGVSQDMYAEVLFGLGRSTPTTCSWCTLLTRALRSKIC